MTQIVLISCFWVNLLQENHRRCWDSPVWVSIFIEAQFSAGLSFLQKQKVSEAVVVGCEATSELKRPLERAGKSMMTYRWVHFKSIEQNLILSSPRNSLWANSARQIVFFLWKCRDSISLIKQPLCHHACLSTLRGWRLWDWMSGEIPPSLRCGKKRPTPTESRSRSSCPIR